MDQGDYLRDRYKKADPDLPRTDTVPPRPVAAPELELTLAPVPDAPASEAPIPVFHPKIFEPPAHTKKSKIPKHPSFKKVSIIIAGLGVLTGLILFGYNTLRPQTPKYSNGKLTSISEQPSAKTQAAKPAFSLYYPSSVPAGYLVDRGTIKYAKDSFIFNIRKDNQTHFYVSEQPINSNFSFDNFKKGLNTPTEISTTLGPGVYGGLNEGILTGVKTTDNTFIIVNCVDTQCVNSSKALIESMKLVSDFSKL